MISHADGAPVHACAPVCAHACLRSRATTDSSANARARALRSGEAAVIEAHRELSAPSHVHDYKLIRADLREASFALARLRYACGGARAVCVHARMSWRVSVRVRRGEPSLIAYVTRRSAVPAQRGAGDGPCSGADVAE